MKLSKTLFLIILASAVSIIFIRPTYSTVPDPTASLFEIDESTNLTEDFHKDMTGLLKSWELFYNQSVNLTQDPNDSNNQVIKFDAAYSTNRYNGLQYQCLYNRPAGKEIYYARFRAYRPSSGNVTTSNYVHVMTLFSFIEVGTGKNISIRFVQFDRSHPTEGVFGLFLHDDTKPPSQRDIAVDYFYRPGVVASFINETFPLDSWHNFEIYYNNKTGTFRVKKDGEELKSFNKMFYPPSDPDATSYSVKSSFGYNFKFAFGEESLGAGARTVMLADDLDSSFSRACREIKNRGQAPI